MMYNIIILYFVETNKNLFFYIIILYQIDLTVHVPSRLLAITFAVLMGGRSIAVASFVQILRSRVSKIWQNILLLGGLSVNWYW